MFSVKSLAVALLAAFATAAPTSDLVKRQSTPVGQVIYGCSVPGTFAITFDDGPFAYTNQLLDILASNGVKGTFFVNGQNFGNINDYGPVIQRMANEGHQIGSHTFNHADLATLDAAGVTDQMTQLESVLLGMIGKFPTYMRPPYFSYNENTLNTLSGLGYRVIQADIDTLDYNYQDNIGVAVENFRQGVQNGGTISLEHDVHQHTVDQLAQQIIDITKGAGLNAVTVGECLGDPAENWYRTGR